MGDNLTKEKKKGRFIAGRLRSDRVSRLKKRLSRKGGKYEKDNARI